LIDQFFDAQARREPLKSVLVKDRRVISALENKYGVVLGAQTAFEVHAFFENHFGAQQITKQS
jgi:hypothetical protein